MIEIPRASGQSGVFSVYNGPTNIWRDVRSPRGEIANARENSRERDMIKNSTIDFVISRFPRKFAVPTRGRKEEKAEKGKIRSELTCRHREAKSSWSTGNCVRYAEQVAIGKVSRTRKSSENRAVAGDDERKVR